MIKRWKQTVRPSHTILHLGDLFFTKKRGLEHFALEIAPKLPGKKCIVLGNHDARNVDYEALGFTVLKPYSINYRGYEVSFDHYPRIIPNEMRRVHVHGHIHGNPYSDGEVTRLNNINVSVEVVDYRPQRFTTLLNKAILAKPGHKGYYNSRGYRYSKRDQSRRAA